MSYSRKYGYFDEDYVVTNPMTPEPWINYLSGKNLDAFISNGAGGTVWFKRPDTGRLTRYRLNGLPMDAPGFYLYVKDDKKIWNPSFFPAMSAVDDYECRHGMGYTRLGAARDGLRVEVKYFIPLHDDVLLWDVKVENFSGRVKRIMLYPYIDFCLHDIINDDYGFWVAGNQARYYLDKVSGGLTGEYFAFIATFHGRTIFSASEPFHQFDMNRDSFIGRGRTEANPVGLEQGLKNTEIPDGGFRACGVFELPVELAPGESRRIVVKLAVDENIDNARSLAKRYDSFAEVDKAFDEITAKWQNALSKCRVTTPDEDVNDMLNTWLPKNIHATMRNGRSISHRHAGTTNCTRFRDTMQDVMSATFLFPENIKDLILMLMRSVTYSGRVVFDIDPETFQSQNPSTRIDAIVWGVFTLHKYLAETDNRRLFDTIIPFYDKGEATVLEHLVRGMRFVGDNTGHNGLPRLFDCDWNDMLNLFSSAREDGETVMVAEQYIHAAKLLIEILEYLDKTDSIPYLQKKIADFTKILSSDVCWDGAWFKRLLYPDAVIGSSGNTEGQIFLNTQTWSVIAGTMPQEMALRAMQSVGERLDTGCGIRIFSPPFTRMMDGVTPFNSNSPGAGENGGLFLHANTWAVIAEAILKNPERAWKYYSQILPNKLSRRNPELYAREPYAFASWLYGPDHQAFGHASVNWLTGGASWMYIAGMEYILGIRPKLNGIEISPCIPQDWPEYQVKREIRGATYYFNVRNPNKTGCGNVEIRVDDRSHATNVIPYAAPGKEVSVSAVIQ